MNQQLVDMAACQICHNRLRDAMSLQCSHSFCNTCICYYNQTNADQVRLCPVCKNEYRPEQLYNNKPLQDIADCINDLQQAVALQSQSSANQSLFASDVSEAKMLDQSTQYSEQNIAVPSFDYIDSQCPPETESVTSGLPSTAPSDMSQHEDVFHQPITKCQVCGHYVSRSKKTAHQERCRPEKFSQFGLATMPRVPAVSKAQNSSARKGNSLQTQINRQASSIRTRQQFGDASSILRLGNVTLQTCIKKIKSDLTAFGLKKQFIDQQSKSTLCKLYNRFVARFKAYYGDNNQTDAEGLKVMICDELIRDMADKQDIRGQDEYMACCRDLFWKQLVKRMDREQQVALLSRLLNRAALPLTQPSQNSVYSLND